MKSYFSYSEMALFWQDRELYYKKYIEGLEIPTSKEQKLGKIIHKAIAEPRFNWILALKKEGFPKSTALLTRKLLNKAFLYRAPAHEVEFFTQESKNLPRLYAVFDGFDKQNRILYEYKTTHNPNKWRQWFVDINKQLSFYAYVYYLLFHSFFREIVLIRLNTETGTVKKFVTTRGPKDLQDS